MDYPGKDSMTVRVNLKMSLLCLVQGHGSVHSPGWVAQHQRFPVFSAVVAIITVLFKSVLFLNRGVREH